MILTLGVAYLFTGTLLGCFSLKRRTTIIRGVRDPRLYLALVGRERVTTHSLRIMWHLPLNITDFLIKPLSTDPSVSDTSSYPSLLRIGPTWSLHVLPVGKVSTVTFSVMAFFCLRVPACLPPLPATHCLPPSSTLENQSVQVENNFWY